MTGLPGDAAQIELEVPGTLEDVDRAVAAVQEFLAQQGHAAPQFGLRLALRESLVNAVRHGCRGDQACQVRLRLELQGTEVRVSVQDPGPGFNWRAALADALPGPEADHGRGLHILRRYTQRLGFADGGRQVRFSLSLDGAPGDGGPQDTG